MGEITWHNDHILLIPFVGDWTLADFINLFEEAQAIVRASEHDAVDVFIDARQSSGFPKGENMAPHLKRVFQAKEIDRIIFVGGSSFGLRMVRLFTKILPIKSNKVAFVNTIAEAEDRLQTIG